MVDGPPFPHYSVSDSEIHTAADDVRGPVRAMEGVTADVNAQSRVALDNVMGDIEEAVGTAPRPTNETATSVRQNSEYAAGCLELFGFKVGEYNKSRSSDPRSVDNLNSAWESYQQSHTDFDLDRSDYEDGGSKENANWSTDLAAAEREAGAPFRAEYGRLQDWLDRQGESIAGMINRGPNADDLRRLYGAGALPSSIQTVFPDVDFSNVEFTRLPEDLADMSDEELADYVMDHPELAEALAPVLTDGAKRLVGEELANRLENLDATINSPEEREEAQRLAELLGAVSKEPTIAYEVATNLGADGAAEVIDNLAHLTGPNALAYFDGDRDEENAFRELQDTMSKALGTTIATASTAGLPTDYGRDLVETSPFAAAMLFRGADQNGAVFGGDFVNETAHAIKDLETGSRSATDWYSQYGGGSYFGTDASFSSSEGDSDPMVQLLKAADNDPESAQAVFLNDREMTKYLLIDRPDLGSGDKTSQDAIGNVLRVATIEQATAYDPKEDGQYDSVLHTGPEDYYKSLNAANISSMVLDLAGEGAEAGDKFDDEIAGIISTYIADVDRAYAAGDDGVPGVYDHMVNGWPEGIKPEDGFPLFGINIDSGDLRDVLQDVGDDENARKLIGQTATGYNQLRLDRGAGDMTDWINDGSEGQSPLDAASSGSAQLQGYLVDALADGMVSDAQADAEERKQVAELFTLPIDFVPTDRIPVGGQAADFIIGKVDESIEKGYVGDGVKVATDHANDDWNETRQRLILQSYDAIRAESQAAINGENGHTNLLTDDQLADWPRTGDGKLKPVSQMSEAEQRELIQNLQNSGNYLGSAETSVENSQDNYESHRD
jgi:hypothetical protein